MTVSLPAELEARVQRELDGGHYQSLSQFVEEAVRHFLEEHERGQRRMDALREIGRAVDEAGLYDRVLIPGRE